jgi:hypothetical protein
MAASASPSLLSLERRSSTSSSSAFRRVGSDCRAFAVYFSGRRKITTAGADDSCANDGTRIRHLQQNLPFLEHDRPAESDLRRFPRPCVSTRGGCRRRTNRPACPAVFVSKRAQSLSAPLIAHRRVEISTPGHPFDTTARSSDAIAPSTPLADLGAALALHTRDIRRYALYRKEEAE